MEDDYSVWPISMQEKKEACVNTQRVAILAIRLASVNGVLKTKYFDDPGVAGVTAVRGDCQTHKPSARLQ
jgi:hypothetical protein